MIAVAVMFIVFAVVVTLTCVVFFMNRKNKLSLQEKINAEAHNKLRYANFNIDKIFYLNDYASCNKDNSVKKFFAVDNNAKKVAFVNYESGSVVISDFSEFLNYEIYENNTLETTGASFGGYWGIFGAETTGSCKNLRLIIRLKDLGSPQICYDIIDTSLGIVKSSAVYKNCITTLQNAVSFLEVLKNQNEKEKTE